MQRRTTEVGEPAKQVIGFSVEGQESSPVPIRAILDEAVAAEDAVVGRGAGGVGSPSLVMIPPAAFQGQSDGESNHLTIGSTSPGGTYHPIGAPPVPVTAGGSHPVSPAAPPIRRATTELPPHSAPSNLDGELDGIMRSVSDGAALRSQETTPAAAATVTGADPGTAAATATADSELSFQTSGGRRKSLEGQQEAASAPPAGAGVGSGAPTAGEKKAERKEKAARAGKGPPTDIQPKPKMTKAERRALQEQQRAAKAAAKAEPGGTQGTPSKPMPTKHSSAKVVQKENTAPAPKRQEAAEAPAPRVEPTDRRFAKQVELFAHLQQYNKIDATRFSGKDMTLIHPAIKDLGLKYAERTITGSNARCVAMLSALKTFIADYRTPAQKMISRDLLARLNKQIDFLAECRPLAVAMGNAIKHLKLRVQQLDPTLPEERAKAILTDTIDNFVMEKVMYADQALVSHAVTKIADGDVVLTYAYSHVVLETLLAAHAAGVAFQVIVIDARPHCEGRGLMAKLLAAGVHCSYEHINALSFIVKQVTKVFLGAAGVLSNGVVLSRVGTAAVGMTAAAFNIPVMVCCETYKFNERVQLDSITSNELGDPNALTSQQPSHATDECALMGWENQSNLILLNLTYDAMPADFVTMIITEIGMVPPSSVPAILREYMKDSKGERV
uniref:Translation initiation factor eIF2B subunit delta n=1 Tax=Tetraselmis chuii TaxID=63592 RepID=A0A7S1STN3_9CHLO|mmetsp:Transcript_27441/g.48902  ORF Transcript_27441/g.48902 Transcript_27441/m.48902 type:complete len:671 (+) Transcript_27441:177-2189(+)